MFDNFSYQFEHFLPFSLFLFFLLFLTIFVISAKQITFCKSVVLLVSPFHGLQTGKGADWVKTTLFHSNEQGGMWLLVHQRADLTSHPHIFACVWLNSGTCLFWWKQVWKYLKPAWQKQTLRVEAGSGVSWLCVVQKQIWTEIWSLNTNTNLDGNTDREKQTLRVEPPLEVCSGLSADTPCVVLTQANADKTTDTHLNTILDTNTDKNRNTKNTEIKKWMPGVETVRWQADGDCQTVSVLNYKPVSCTMYNVQLYMYLYMASVANVLEGYFLGGGNFSALVWIQSLL